jgi:uncharacterized membrane protein YqhA
MTGLLTRARYLIVIPILGLAIAATFFFIFGGIGLIRLLIELVLAAVGLAHDGAALEGDIVIVEVVEFVHTFLLGTVLYITALGLYQLFIGNIRILGWLKVESTEELETNLIGVTVVVLAVNFMGEVFANRTADVLNYGVGIALPIAALGVFLGLRAWAARLNRDTAHRTDDNEE